MIHIALMTEFSFKKSFLHMRDIHKYVSNGCVGIADINNTMGHIELLKESKKHGFTPIYGVRLHVLPDDSKQRVCNTYWVFIAKNNDGLKEIYQLVEKAYEQFYYMPKLSISDVSSISDNVISISPDISEYSDFQAYGQGFSNISNCTADLVAIDRNNFPLRGDRHVYELMAGARRQGNGYSYMFESCTYPQHIMSEEEWMSEYNKRIAVDNTYRIAKTCIVNFPRAEMVEWGGDHDIKSACLRNRSKVKGWDDEYSSRLDHEVNLIENKGYVDYFMIVADLINHAKKTMLVGPARGSSAGSLVCYLLNITEIDPVKHNLIFERFIDVNRYDLPDIDIDFPDVKRDECIKYLKSKYGDDRVMCLATVNRFKPKSAIGEIAKSLGIPPYETEAVKDSIIERSSADARAAMCIEDTLNTTEVGKKFIKKYPAMSLSSRVEGHASHSGKHAAGIIVSTLPLNNYGSLNPRDEVIMMDKKHAEYINLLKIDCLGLRNLSILEGVAKQIGMPFKAFYTIDLDDEDTYDLFNSMRLSGIFQFEGQALQMVVKQMGVRNFNDIAAITALARPGALNSGGTARYVKYAKGEEEPVYYSDVHKEITEETFGIVVYQEQMIQISRRIGGLSWSDTGALRTASSKSMGDEFFGKYKEKFVKGAEENGYNEADREQIWIDISASGSWSFNKSHAVAYGLVSYWTAYCKANFPMEFAVASLNHASSNESAIKLLRDLVKNEGMEYVPVDPDKSDLNWTCQDGILVGGLTNIKGIGVSKARKIISARKKGGSSLTPSLYKAMMNPKTEFDIIFPARHYWGFLYDSPGKYGIDREVSLVKDVSGKGQFVLLGCLVDRNVRDLNEHVFLSKRDGQLIEEDNLYLNFRLEDDTDSILCKISRFRFEAMGRKIAESGRIGKDWYLVKGEIKSDWRRVDVYQIVNLNQTFNVET